MSVLRACWLAVTVDNAAKIVQGLTQHRSNLCRFLCSAFKLTTRASRSRLGRIDRENGVMRDNGGSADQIHSLA
jgi:hypothetical protein